LRTIQEWLGHRSIEMTVRYARISQRRFQWTLALLAMGFHPSLSLEFRDPIERRKRASTKCLRSTNEIGSCGDMLVDDAVTCCLLLTYVFKSISVRLDRVKVGIFAANGRCFFIDLKAIKCGITSPMKG